jgi:hypothetical protein
VEHDSKLRAGAALATGAGIGGTIDGGISEGASSQTGRIDAGRLAAVRGDGGPSEFAPEARIEVGPSELGPIEFGFIEFGPIESGAIDSGAMLSDGSEPGAPEISESGSNEWGRSECGTSECGTSDPSGGPTVGNASGGVMDWIGICCGRAMGSASSPGRFLRFSRNASFRHRRCATGNTTAHNASTITGASKMLSRRASGARAALTTATESVIPTSSPTPIRASEDRRELFLNRAYSRTHVVHHSSRPT